MPQSCQTCISSLHACLPAFRLLDGHLFWRFSNDVCLCWHPGLRMEAAEAAADVTMVVAEGGRHRGRTPRSLSSMPGPLQSASAPSLGNAACAPA